MSGRASLKRYKIVDQTPDKLMQLYLQQLSQIERPVLASDRTAWLRPHARTLKERTYEHQPTVYLSASVKDRVRAQAFAESNGSWALPLRHERITSWHNPISFGAGQLAQVCQYLQHRPIALFDSSSRVRPFGNSHRCERCRSTNAYSLPSLLMVNTPSL